MATLAAPVIAIVLGILCLVILHTVKSKPILREYLTRNVVDWVTIGIILYIVCFWVIGSITVLITSHTGPLPYYTP